MSGCDASPTRSASAIARSLKKGRGRQQNESGIGPARDALPEASVRHHDPPQFSAAVRAQRYDVVEVRYIS